MFPRFSALLLAGFLFIPSVHAQPPAKPRVDSLGDPLPPGAIARLGTLRLRHDPANGAAITRALFSPDGKKIASVVGRPGTIRLWDAGTGKELPGPWSSGQILATAIAFSPDSAILAAATFDQPTGAKPFILWDIAPARSLLAIKDNRRTIDEMAFTADGKTLVTVGEEAVQWWDIVRDKEQRFWKLPAEVLRPPAGFEKNTPRFSYALSPEGSYLAFQITWNAFHKASAWDAVFFDLGRGKEQWRARLEVENGGNPFVTFSAENKRAAIAESPGKVELRDLTSGKLLASNQLGTRGINGLAFSSDNKSLAISLSSGRLVLWESDKIGKAREIVLPAPFKTDHTPLAFSHDGRKLLTAVNRELLLYNIATLKNNFPWPRHHGQVEYLNFSADGKTLISSSSEYGDDYFQEGVTWDAVSWMALQSASRRTAKWPDIGSVSPDFNFFIGRTAEDRILLHDMATGKPLAPLARPKNTESKPGIYEPPYGVFSLGSKFYLLPHDDDISLNRIDVYAVPSGKFVGFYHLGPRELPRFDQSQAISPNGTFVAMTGDDGRIQVINLATGKPRHFLGETRPFFKDMAPHRILLAFSSDGKQLASWIRPDSAILVWDLVTGKECHRFAVDPESVIMKYFAWSPDARTLAVARNKIELWELATNKVRCEFEQQRDIGALAFSPDGRLLAAGSADTTILIWDLLNRERLSSPSVVLKPADLEAHWQILASDDAGKAFPAICELIASPKDAVAWIKGKVKPATKSDQMIIDQLIIQLEDVQYKVRQKASAELLQIGERAVPTIEKVLAANPPLETRLRLQELRTKLTGIVLQGERLQAYRAVEVLERIGTAEARQLLQSYADGAPGAMLTTQAQAALERLTKR